MECTQTLQVKERLFSQQNLELTKKLETDLDETRKSKKDLEVKIELCEEQLQKTLEQTKAQVTEKDKQIRELKSQRDSLFVEI